jgi:guanylate kinase
MPATSSSVPQALTYWKLASGPAAQKEENVQRRLAEARIEMKYADIPGVHDKVVVNDELEKAYTDPEGFILSD